MDIEGRLYYLENSRAQHKALKKSLKLLLDAIVTSADADVDANKNVDSNTGNSTAAPVKIGKLTLQRGSNPLKTCNCITLTNVYLDREVLDALADNLEAILETPFFLYAAGDTRLHVKDDYQLRLDAVMASVNPVATAATAVSVAKVATVSAGAVTVTVATAASSDSLVEA